MFNLKQFAEDYAPLLLKIYPKSIEMFMLILANVNDDLLLDNSLSKINKDIYDRNPWNATDRKARNVLEKFELIKTNSDGRVIICSRLLSAAERFELYWSNDMYSEILEAIEDDILRRKGYKEVIEEGLHKTSFIKEVFRKMGLDPDEAMQLLKDLKEKDSNRYSKIVDKLKNDEQQIKQSLSRMKIFKDVETKVSIPKDANLSEVVGLNGYKIPNDLVYDEENNTYKYLCTIDYCKENGHLDKDKNLIPIEKWNVFQFVKVFLDEFYDKLGHDYPEESDGILISKELDATSSLKKGRSIWKKKGVKISRLFKDIQVVMKTMKDNVKTKEYIEWWFRSSIVREKGAEYTSGWLRSSLMMTAFMRERANVTKSKVKTLPQNIINEICSIDGFIERNYDRVPETVNDIKLLVEQFDMFEDLDPRKKAVEICKREGII